MVNNLNDRKEKYERLTEYLCKTDEISVIARLDSLRYFNYFYDINFDSDYIPHYVYAAYDDCGILPHENNRYDIFVNELSNKMNINCNILEVGGGTKYRTASRIAKMQSGTIEVFDKQLYTTSSPYSNLKLYKVNFNHMTDIRKYNLIEGQYPCQATELMIKRALEENKDLFIHICQCVHPIAPFLNMDLSHFGERSKEYQEEVIDYYIKQAKEYGRTIDVFKNNNLTNPFIYSHRK